MPRLFTFFAVLVPIIAVFLVCRSFDVTARITLSWPLALHPDTPGEAAQVYVAPDAHDIPSKSKNHGHAGSKPAAHGDTTFTRRIVAVGDLHGDMPNAQKVLHMAGVVDEEGHWSGGVDYFVQTGDIIDRYAYLMTFVSIPDIPCIQR